jgi:hypothetical protein
MKSWLGTALPNTQLPVARMPDEVATDPRRPPRRHPQRFSGNRASGTATASNGSPNGSGGVRITNINEEWL